uniref:BPI2 domain-containing protein n=1 Tax=Syphacia muris TaxID=451379 RepID=A0A0N5AN03_9BILA
MLKDGVIGVIMWCRRRRYTTATISSAIFQYRSSLFTKLLLVLVVTQLSCSTIATASNTYHPILLSEHVNANSPTALRVRFYQEAIRYFNEIASNILAEQLPRIKIPNIHHRLSSEQGNIMLKRVRVSRFRRARVHNITVTEPNKVIWTMTGLNMWILGDLSGVVDIVVPLNLEGMAEIQADGIDFYLESALERSDTGAGHLSTISCKTYIRQVTVENHNGGLAGIALNLFKIAISEHIRPLIQTLICKKVTRFIDEDLNEKLAQIQTKLPLSTAFSDNLLTRQSGLTKTSGVARKLPFNLTTFLREILSDNFLINYRLNENPKCFNNTAELASVGSVEVKDSYSPVVPFQPPPLRWDNETITGDEMVSLLFSDHIPNSLFYHAFRQDLLNINIDERSAPSLGQFLRTSCNFDAVCLADLLPELSERYPNSKIQLTFTATRPPVLIFSSKNEGTISMNINGLILMYVNLTGFEKKQVAVLELDAVTTNNLHIKNNSLYGKLTLEKFDVRNHINESSLMSDEELSNLALLSSEMLENMINDALSDGFPIPLPEIISLSDAKLKFFDREAMLTSRFLLDQRRVRAIASRTLFNNQAFRLNLRQKVEIHGYDHR